MFRVVLVGFMIIISYVLQTTIFQELTLGVVAPNLMMILVCSYALLRGKKEGLIVGFLAGLIIDLFYGYYEVIGINALLYMIAGLLVGLFHNYLYLEDILIPVVAVGVCDFVYSFIYYVITFALRNRLDMVSYIKSIMVPELVYTIFVAVFAYRLIMFINKKLEAFENRGEKEID